MRDKEYSDYWAKKASWLEKFIKHFENELLPDYKAELELELKNLQWLTKVWA